MKIAFMCYDWPGCCNGPIVNAKRLLPELHQRGHEIHALIQFYQGSSPATEYLGAQGIRVHSIEAQPWTEDRIKWILERLKEIRPDIFVPNSSVAGWYAARWAQAAGIPSIGVHRNDDQFHNAFLERFVHSKKEWALAGLVCVSQSTYDTVRKSQPEHTQLSIIPSGVPIPKAHVDQRTGPINLIYVGRLVEKQKRILETIDAMAAVLLQLPKSRGTLVGECRANPCAQTIDARIKKHNLGNRLSRLEAVDPLQLHEALIKHKVLVLLSDYEGTPGAVMDGMASGLIPVCLNISGGIRELVKHEQTGLLVSDRGAEFVSAVARLASDVDLRERLSTNARKYIEERFSLQKAADSWERLMADLVARKNPKSSRIPPFDAYRLPTVLDGLAREDERRPAFHKRILRPMRKALKSAKWKPALKFRRPAEEAQKKFLDPKCSPRNLDLYFIRKSILKALLSKRKNFAGKLLDVGCGQMPYKNIFTKADSGITHYIGLDLDDNQIHKNSPDITWKDGHIPLEDGSVDCVLCTEVLEHCPDPADILKEIRRVMRPGGFLFLTTPFIWPLHESPFDHYRYTPFSLENLLQAAGFESIQLHPMGGWDAALAQLIGLWARRSRRGRLQRLILSFAVMPVYYSLLQLHKTNKIDGFQDGMMFPGIWGTAVRSSSKIIRDASDQS